MSSFFIRQVNGGEAHGPYTREKLHAMLGNGLIGDGHVASVDGADWLPVAFVLRGRQIAPSMPKAPTSAEPASALVPPRLNLSRPAAAPAINPPSASQSILAPKSPSIPMEEAPPFGASEPSYNYYLLPPSGTGEASGPWSIAKLKSMLQAGHILAQHQVACPGDDCWRPVSSLLVKPSAQPAPQAQTPSSSICHADVSCLNVEAKQGLDYNTISFKAGGRGQPVTGWLALLAIGVFISPIGQVIYFLKWFSDVNNGLAEGQFGSLKFSIKSLLVFEISTMIALIALACWRAWLFFEKRAKFKFTNIAWFVSLIAFSGLDLFFCRLLEAPFDEKAIGELVRGIFYAAIWIPYTLKAKQVKDAFVG